MSQGYIIYAVSIFYMTLFTVHLLLFIPSLSLAAYLFNGVTSRYDDR